MKYTLALLKLYDGPYKLTLHSGASEALINEAERVYGITLPDDFKTFYRFTDGFEIDEDIFNIIPLKEMMDNKKSDEPIWIAEYMIYSDMWALEINASDPNDYSIFMGDKDRGKIILTHSFGEFIQRVLNNGVFDIGGLYHWMDEIKAKAYGNTDPKEIKPLIGIFSKCLDLGLILKQRVIQWADWIISTEESPDPFFIEISSSRDLNDLLAILDSINLIKDIVQIRVVFGEVYLQLLTRKMAVGQTMPILNKFVHEKEFTVYEINEMRYLVDKWEGLINKPNKRLQKRLAERIKLFFDNYNRFNLYDYKNWDDINTKIVKDFSSR